MTQIGKAIGPRIPPVLRGALGALLIWSLPATGLAKPDLTVLELKQLPPNAAVNTGEVSVKISNLGDSTTWFINLDVGFYIDGYLCDSVGLIGGLGGSKSTVKTTTKCNPATPGPHNFQVAVDYTNEVEESSETNNTVNAVFLWYDSESCAATETCNGVDDTCNGEVDETFFELGQACDGGDEDSCKQGVFVCNQAGTGVTCDEPTGVIAELCNGVDDDCNGSTDEGFEPTGTVCTEVSGTCVIEGLWECDPSGLSSVCVGVPINSGAELCNHADDDCDGSTDEGFDFVGSPCLQGTGACRGEGVYNCMGSNPSCGALEGFPPTPTELCGNREDDNCNGIADEGCPCGPGSYIPCGSSVGACQLGILECADDNTLSGKCVGATLPTDEICDNDIDDDCDGSIDEGCSCVNGFVRPCSPGTGMCATGSQACYGSFWGLCTPKETPTIELCDIVDNDCDGVRDEGCPCIPGDIQLCSVQKDACADYYAICTETFKWSPCLAKPGTEDPTCGEGEPDTVSPPDTEQEWNDVVETGDTGGQPPFPYGMEDAFTAPPEETGTTKKVIVVQQEPAGCQHGAPTAPLFGLGLCCLFLWARNPSAPLS